MGMKLWGAASVALVLAGCGGGGGAAPVAASATPASFNMEAAFTSALSSGINFPSLAATVNGTPYTVAVSIAPASDSTLLNATQVFHRAVETVSIAQNGSSVGTASTTIFYLSGPLQIAATIQGQGGIFTTNSPKSTLPTAGAIGETGTLNTGVEYASISNNAIVANTVTTWSLEADTSSTALACLTTTLTSVGNSTQKVCLRITPSGAIEGAQVTLPVAGAQAVFQ